ncbi:hypothetical protein DSO57_1011784 [Entomophthora muscae]|uniref:Uncharacterized protein n=1 Tax=Entomophthora muscae TaxID=34485 RepID=A0ACC2TH66_9FUNG|nr:hypothetical protein DSO57_1011784 [Entomophthora muscae]
MKKDAIQEAELQCIIHPQATQAAILTKLYSTTLAYSLIQGFKGHGCPTPGSRWLQRPVLSASCLRPCVRSRASQSNLPLLLPSRLLPSVELCCRASASFGSKLTTF